jgi:hypothetical protein
MTDSHDVLKARAEAAFRAIAQQVREDAIAEYKAKHEAELDKAARLRAMRLAVVARVMAPYSRP